MDRLIVHILNKNNMGVVIMPNRDGTGPEGRGPRTGRGKGRC